MMRSLNESSNGRWSDLKPLLTAVFATLPLHLNEAPAAIHRKDPLVRQATGASEPVADAALKHAIQDERVLALIERHKQEKLLQSEIKNALETWNEAIKNARGFAQLGIKQSRKALPEQSSDLTITKHAKEALEKVLAADEGATKAIELVRAILASLHRLNDQFGTLTTISLEEHVQSTELRETLINLRQLLGVLHIDADCIARMRDATVQRPDVIYAFVLLILESEQQRLETTSRGGN
jgi:hypothetical protein